MISHKKTVVQILLFLLLISCTKPGYLKHGKVSLHSTADKNSFVFSVDNEFEESSKNSPRDKKNPTLSEAESGLLMALLKQKKYCLGNYGAPKFVITSKQERVYDMTFAHMIQESYNAKAIAPKMYFGQCAQG